jgi:hypothetical protein
MYLAHKLSLEPRGKLLKFPYQLSTKQQKRPAIIAFKRKQYKLDPRVY